MIFNNDKLGTFITYKSLTNVFSQLKSDGFCDVAIQLQELYLNNSGYLLKDVVAADSLLKIVAASQATSDCLMPARDNLDHMHTASR